jgi:hypothetical protein
MRRDKDSFFTKMEKLSSDMRFLNTTHPRYFPAVDLAFVFTETTCLKETVGKLYF